MSSNEISNRPDPYELAKTLDRITPLLGPSSGPAMVAALCERLDRVIEAASDEKLRGTAVDLSTMWRNDLAEHQSGHEHDPRSLVVSAILETAKKHTAAGGAIAEILDALRHHEKWIYRRIELHLARLHGDEAIAGKYLLQREAFSSASTHREYISLLSSVAGKLDPERMGTILAWIDEGDQDRFRSNYGSAMSRQPSNEELREHNEVWRLMWLTAVRDRLDKSRTDELVGLESKFGAMTTVQAQTARTWYGSESPLTEDQLGALSGKNLLDFARTRSAKGDLSIDGLARQLTEISSGKPDLFETVSASDLPGLDPTFAHSIILGFEQAARKGSQPPWRFIFDLATYILSNPGIPGRGGDRFDYDADWSSARKSLAILVSTGLGIGEGLAPGFEESAWKLIDALAGDADPTPQYEQAYGPPNMSPSVLSMNSVRSLAVAAAIEFAVWRQRTGGVSPLDPRVQDLLERHLRDDHSIAVRSVYGQRLSQLIALDALWVGQHLAELLGASLGDSTLGRIAWTDFLAFSQPASSVFDVLRDYYGQAVGLLGSAEASDLMASRLAYHLAVHYVWRKVDLATGGLVDEFFQRASLKARRHFLESLGHLLAFNPEPSLEIAGLFRSLWEWREQSLTEQGGDRSELAEFGWWFGSDRLDPAWSLLHLQIAIRAVGAVDNPLSVVERLGRLAKASPREVIECLWLMVGKDTMGWSVFSWDEVIRGAVAEARSAPDQSTREAAEIMVSRLLAKGYLQYRDLAL